MLENRRNRIPPEHSKQKQNHCQFKNHFNQQVTLVFTWLRHVLQECPRVTEAFQELQNYLVKMLLTRYAQVLMNSLHAGSKPAHTKSGLMLLVTIASLGYKFTKLLQLHLDFTHANWPGLLSKRNRKVRMLRCGNGRNRMMSSFV